MGKQQSHFSFYLLAGFEGTTVGLHLEVMDGDMKSELKRSGPTNYKQNDKAMQPA